MDQLHRAINDSLSVRLVAAITTDASREGARRQEAQASEAIALSRGISAGCLLATLAKGDKERVRIHLRASGPAQALIVDAHGDGRVRACLKTPLPPDAPQAQFASTPTGRPSVAAALGSQGELSVVRDLGLKQPYEGNHALASGEVDEDLALYLNKSEQLPSLLVCDARLDAAGRIAQSAGILCQAFPGADPDVLDRFRETLAEDNLYQFLRQERSVTDLLQLASGGESMDIMGEPRSLRFECSCGVARARSVLATLGAQELHDLANERESVDITCNFCRLVTTFSAQQVHDLADEISRSQS